MAWDKTAERAQLSAEIAALESQSTIQLRERWKRSMGPNRRRGLPRSYEARGRLPYSKTPAWRPQRLDAPPA
jgi:hypothetical protein